MRKSLIIFSRTLLGVYFLSAGISKFLFWDTHIILMETHNMKMVSASLLISGSAQIIGSICLLLNKQVVICSLGFAVMVLLINFNLHDFWNTYEGIDTSHETQNFIKNLGVMIAFLLLAALNIREINEP
tara:strand:+ start:1575 stop:1961 length:387 start_codon:yes stop_codon:yes gene_type:complete